KNIPQFITRTRQVPVAPARPAAQRPTPLRIVVNGTRLAAPAPRQSAVQSIRANEGVSAQRAYDLANSRAAERARQNAGPSGYSTVTSGDKRYDATSGNWV